MESMVGLVLIILVFAVICLVVSGMAFEKGKRHIGYFHAVLGALLLFVGSLVAYGSGYGRAARLSDLNANTVYCVAAKVDDTYVIRNVGKNENYLVYSPMQPLPGACFVKKDGGKFVAVTPATTFDGKVVGIPITPPAPK